jgi:agmatine deiminase
MREGERFLMSLHMKLDRRRFISAMAATLSGGLVPRPALANSSDPRLADYEMPLESESHERTFMQWPVSLEVYDRAGLVAVQKEIALIANTISQFEPVTMLASRDAAPAARKQLSASIDIMDCPTDDLWCRDSGPTFVRNKTGQLAVSHIQFNGWGGKQAHENDAKVAERVANQLGLPLLATGLVGEQGGVEHDGAGTLLAHASSWVNKNRNTGTQEEIAALLSNALGGKKVIFAPGIAGADITDYHIDSLARFVSPGTVLIQLPAQIDPDDPWSRAAFETYDILKRETDAAGNMLTIIAIKEPIDARVRSKDFVASYVNYYVCNGAVIGAEFGDSTADEAAKAALESLYPGRTVIALKVDEIGRNGGGIHCATQQQPKV